MDLDSGILQDLSVEGGPELGDLQDGWFEFGDLDVAHPWTLSHRFHCEPTAQADDGHLLRGRVEGHRDVAELILGQAVARGMGSVNFAVHSHVGNVPIFALEVKADGRTQPVQIHDRMLEKVAPWLGFESSRVDRDPGGQSGRIPSFECPGPSRQEQRKQCHHQVPAPTTQQERVEEIDRSGELERVLRAQIWDQNESGNKGPSDTAEGVGPVDFPHGPAQAPQGSAGDGCCQWEGQPHQKGRRGKQGRHQEEIEEQHPDEASPHEGEHPEKGGGEHRDQHHGDSSTEPYGQVDPG